MLRLALTVSLLLSFMDSDAQIRFERMRHKLPYRINPTVIERDSFALIIGGFSGEAGERDAYKFENGKFTLFPLDYPGQGKSAHIGFSNDSFLYLGGGMDTNIARYGVPDFWRYNWTNKEWKQLKDLPFPSREAAATAWRDGKLYTVISILDTAGKMTTYSTKILQYDPAADAWGELTAFPFRYHWGGPAFFTESSAYVLTTNDKYGDKWSGDFYRYDFSTGKWLELERFPGQQRIKPFAFMEGGKIYVGDGTFPFTDDCQCSDIYVYDLELKRWAKVMDTKFSLAHAKSWKTAGVRYLGIGRDRAGEDIRSLFRVTMEP